MRQLVRAVRSIGHLDPRDLPEMFKAFLVALVVEVGLHVLRLPRLARLVGVPLDLEDREPIPMVEPLPEQAWHRVALANAVLRHWPFGNTCLRRSLVAGNRIRHLHPSLRVGVARDGDIFRAHAWLEIDRCYFDAGASSFSSILTFES